ncbi:hypothetical protein NM208_g4867 [Fusarium decemcellulare]|uniref:Uncharacterized protein n=1 Tax=Fusarium decemcellulare TaxID=57161 RepID=A0ACC1SJ20_9HYPO|nr:hypothetical protein NM208_g4867 [Fusarium decemcellulare]
MTQGAEFLRYASPNELRTIAREDAGYYHAVIIGAVYEFADGVDVKSPQTFFHPLKRCIEEHPFFCVTVGDRHSDKAFYQRVPSINLEDHISIIEDPAVTADPLNAIGKSLVPELGLPFVAGKVPWRIVVLPLEQSRCFIAFSFSHMIGDGPTGVAFHKTFLAGCIDTPEDKPSAVVVPPAKPLPAPFDTPERLPISWSFLLAPFIANFIPHFIVKLLGLRVSASTINEGTWTGAPMFFDLEKYQNKLKIREIEAPLLQKAVQTSREHDAKLTGVIEVLIARALSKAVPDAKVTNFVSQTAINMRRSLGISDDVGGVMVSGCNLTYARSNASGPLTEEEWASARSSTKELAKTATTLQDQPIGLLRFLPSVRKWTLTKLGKSRDSSFEMSNVGAFDAGQGASEAGGKQAKMTKMVFTQPGHVTGPPIAFNFAAVKGGNLVYTVTWQPGALGLGLSEDQEEAVVEDICATLQQGFKDLA